jgi:hypothetical protein
MSSVRPGRLVAVFLGTFVILTAAAAAILSATLDSGPVPMHVRWKPGIADADRVALEQRFRLTEGVVTEGTTRAYRLADTSTANIRAIVQHPSVDDTADINRIRFRPAFKYDRDRRLIFFSIVAGGIATLAVLLTPRVSRTVGLRRAVT